MILAIDTTGPVIGVAAGSSAATANMKIERVSRGAEGRIVPWCTELTGGLERVEAIVVAIGPGAFTGLRVGLASAQGLALALQVPLLGASGLAARAHWADCDVTLLDARKGRVYAGWRADAFEPADVAPEAAVTDRPAGFRAVGEGALVYRTVVEAAGGVVVESADHPGTAALIDLAVAQLKAGEVGEPDAVQPLYVRAPDAVPPKRGV